jgi:hypothetical protein
MTENPRVGDVGTRQLSCVSFYRPGVCRYFGTSQSSRSRSGGRSSRHPRVRYATAVRVTRHLHGCGGGVVCKPFAFDKAVRRGIERIGGKRCQLKLAGVRDVSRRGISASRVRCDRARGAGPDGGVDLALARGHERFLVQCKQWRARHVGVAVVRELYGVMAAERVTGGYVVTSGTYTKDAREFASGRNIELVDGGALSALLRNSQNNAPAPSSSRVAAKSSATRMPMCPTCKTPMVMRTAKRGSNVGSSFWGCAQYPKCRQTLAT